MFTGLKQQFGFGDDFINDIVPLHHNLVKLKNILIWGEMNMIYRSCFSLEVWQCHNAYRFNIGVLDSRVFV